MTDIDKRNREKVVHVRLTHDEHIAWLAKRDEMNMKDFSKFVRYIVNEHICPQLNHVGMSKRTKELRDMYGRPVS